jgi:hypothetical protein
VLYLRSITLSDLGDAPCIIDYLDSLIVLGGNNYNTGNQQYNFTTQTWKTLAALSPGYSYFGCSLMPATSDRKVSSPLYQDKILMMQNVQSDVTGISQVKVNYKLG